MINKAVAVVLLFVFAMATLLGCGNKAGTTLEGTARDDILTFKNNEENRPVVRIAMQYYMPDGNFLETLEQQFPDYLFVMDYSAAAGVGSENRLLEMLKTEAPYDLVISGRSNFASLNMDYFVDLSAEGFLDNYLLSALNNVSIGGKIYFLPGISMPAGIAYNKNLFAENGWKVPSNTDEFFTLCEKARAKGVKPFSNCCKYATQINRLFGTMCYDQLYMSADSVAWMNKLLQNQAAYTGHMEPFYELAKRFYDADVITIDDFTASLTEQRHAFLNGEYAMMYADTNIYTYAQTEGAAFEVGFMPFPAKDSSNSGYCIMPAYYMAIPKTAEQDPARLALMKEILSYLSTAEGQKSMLADSFCISNIKNVDISDSPVFEYIQTAYEQGNLYADINYEGVDFSITERQKASIQTIFEGGTVTDAIAMMDDSIQKGFSEKKSEAKYETLATAEEDFTVLETSYYLADQFRALTGSDIGLMINRGYFRSNLAAFSQGEITSDMSMFVMKGVSADDYLTTYKLTGAQVKTLLEYPIVDDEQTDVFIAASGLAIEYAPWNERGARVLKVTLEDGSELQNDSFYTVAAWAGVIDSRYLSESLQVYDALGTVSDIVQVSLEEDGTIKPDIERRVTLVWPEAK